MPAKFTGTKKPENWDRVANQELKRRDRVAAKKARKKLRAETRLWELEANQELKCRGKVAAKNARERERAERLKWSKEIQEELNRREKQRDSQEEKAWKGSKKFAQICRRFRRKIERREPPAFNVVKMYSNHNAKFTTYFDTYKVYVYGRVDPVAIFKKALDLTVEERRLKQVIKYVLSCHTLCSLNRLV